MMSKHDGYPLAVDIDDAILILNDRISGALYPLARDALP